MPNLQTIGKIVRFLLIALTGLSVMKRILPASVIEYLSTDSGLQETVEITIALGTLLWSFYVSQSKDIGQKIALQASPGTPLENVRAQTAALPPLVKVIASIRDTPIEEVLAREEAKTARSESS